MFTTLKRLLEWQGALSAPVCSEIRRLEDVALAERDAYRTKIKRLEEVTAPELVSIRRELDTVKDEIAKAKVAADSLGSIFDPTLYRTMGPALGQDLELAQIFRSAQLEIEKLRRPAA